MMVHVRLRKIYQIICLFSILQAVLCLNTMHQTVSQYLIDKYSNSSGFLTKMELQNLLDRLSNCCAVNSASPGPGAMSAHCVSSNNCSSNGESLLSAENVFRILEIDDGEFTASSLDKACPLLLGELENSTCSSDSSVKDTREERRKPSQSEVWGYGFLFVTLISLCSVLGVSVLPFMGKDFYKQLLTALIGLAVGSLAASSVFHLIPQAFSLADTDIHHSYLRISLMMWGGVWVFFMTERIMKVINDARQKKISRQKISNPIPTVSSQTNISHQSQKTLDNEPLQQTHDICVISDPGAIYDYQEQAIKASFGHQEKPHVSHEHVMHFEQGKDSAIATVAWMVIFGDGLHNFIDGLSIGAAFNESILTGISISVAVMCEEFPHELGS
ncbi:metal cation symporter ZIP14-like isoform X2 [Ischnura elegans]|uniref:metal cation symporter ZIP14-like isoform X2 n=1 Tax=Ischnura elegans TaxID=197161 RepID=UPI001ED88A3C|nr:metal cation symporter ZIP14-like isoform X2 [Ischnura elegans]